jgi:hypothetical protein
MPRVATFHPLLSFLCLVRILFPLFGLDIAMGRDTVPGFKDDSKLEVTPFNTGRRIYSGRLVRRALGGRTRGARCFSLLLCHKPSAC